MSPKQLKESFSFGVGLAFLSTSGSSSTPFLFSSPTNPHIKPKGKDVESFSRSINSSQDGEWGKLGNLLQRENHPNRGQDNQVDKAGSNRDLGMV